MAENVTLERESQAEEQPICGIVMPISAIDGCTDRHWKDVLDILSSSIESAGFKPNLVSTTEEVATILKTIVQNLFNNPVVVCDVSGKNPNVMFELGLRLAFDKPTIVVKDDKTSYSFDTASIEHLEYPRDLRFGKIVEFKRRLADKLSATHSKANSDPNYTTFLKHFGEFKVAKLDQKEVSGQEYIIEELRNLRRDVGRLRGRGPEPKRARRSSNYQDVCMGRDSPKELMETMDILSRFEGVSVSIRELGPNHRHLEVEFSDASKDDREQIRELLKWLPAKAGRIKEAFHASVAASEIDENELASDEHIVANESDSD